MENKENNKLNDLIEEYGIKDMNDAHDFVKMLTVESIQTALDAELDEKHGYSKYDYKIKTQRIVAMAIRLRLFKVPTECKWQ